MDLTQFTFLPRPAPEFRNDLRREIFDRPSDLGDDITLIRGVTDIRGSKGTPPVVASSNRPFDQVANTCLVGGPTGIEDRPPIERVPLTKGFRLHKYQIDEVIGEGGFALMYRARDPDLGRCVAIKELFMSQIVERDSSGSLKLIYGDKDQEAYDWVKFFFSREAQLTVGQRHDGIIRMYEFFRKNNTAYIVYELVDGVTLKDWILENEQAANQAQLMQFVDRTCRSLCYLHGNGVVHRDIKPENILVSQTMDDPILIDFGSAIELQSPDDSGIPIVTKGYSPPEQYFENCAVDKRLDVYSYAATLYTIFSRERPADAMERKVSDQLVPIHELVEPEFAQSKRLCDAIMRGLSVKPEDRQPDLKAFLDDIYPRPLLAKTGYSAKPRGDKIFISYRRGDSAHFSGRVLDFLELRFGSGSVFYDVESIPIGTDFWDCIKDALSQCAALLIVIGPNWLDLVRSRRKRWYHLQKPEDFVAMEIAAAAELKIPIFPILFDQTPMPVASKLPEEIAFIQNLNASLISDGTGFRSGMDALCDQLAKLRAEVQSDPPQPD